MTKRLAILGIAAIVLCLAGSAEFGQQEFGQRDLKRLKRFDKVLPYRGADAPEMIKRSVSSGTTIPMWTYRVASPVDHKTYSGMMVGRNPATNGRTTTSVPTQIVPIIIHMLDSGLYFDPTTPDACSPTESAVNLTSQSPIFQAAPFTFGGTYVGTTQYTDAFQRANFWKNVPHSGPSYHTLLGPVTVLPPITVDVPATMGLTYDFTVLGVCDPEGVIDINQWDPLVTNTIIPSLAARGVNPTTLPLFEVYNVVWSVGTPDIFGQCCILGYHGATGSPVQTYSPFDYDATGLFGTQDIDVLSHEVGEWLDDPLGTNPTPAWGNIGQVIGCQNNLEVGDPLSGTDLPAIPMTNGFAYHVQELAFFSWFYRQRPSIAVRGWYSDNHTFTAGAGPVCH